MTSAEWIAIIASVGALVSALIAPSLLARSNARARYQDTVSASAQREQESSLRTAEKEADWKRQDAVAAQAAEAARLLVEQNHRAESRDREQRRKLDQIDAQGRAIHVLVNSNMTAAMQAELDSTIRELAMMQEVVSLKRKLGSDPTPVAQRAIDLTESKIIELTAQLQDRTTAAKVVADAAAAGKGLPPMPGPAEEAETTAPLEATK